MQHFKYFVLTLVLGALVLPPFAYASAGLEVSGWVPYWRDSEGIKDAKKHLPEIDAVYPFAFTVKLDGTLYDNAGLTKKDWKSFIKTAQKKNVEIIPTIMWSSGDTIHAVLSNPVARAKHIDEIVKMVLRGKYDGVGIDYESKNAETIDYFSAFLRELKAGLGEKILTCTVEARTPPDSLYKEVPAVLTYANDYKEIAKHCDRVEIMAYDQQRADLKLNSSKNGFPYIPLADVDWVRKVVELALEDIPKEKLILGIPTYGHHWAVTVAPDWFRDYRKIGALNVPDILDVAKDYRVKPTRNKAGEMSFTYVPKTAEKDVQRALKVAKNAPGDAVAKKALAYANKTGETVTINIAWYSDVLAMKDKIDLAEEFNLRGVALFNIDGEEDQKVWQYLK
jgi:spore germination protein YaaH